MIHAGGLLLSAPFGLEERISARHYPSLPASVPSPKFGEQVPTLQKLFFPLSLLGERGGVRVLSVRTTPSP